MTLNTARYVKLTDVLNEAQVDGWNECYAPICVFGDYRLACISKEDLVNWVAKNLRYLSHNRRPEWMDKIDMNDWNKAIHTLDALPGDVLISLEDLKKPPLRPREPITIRKMTKLPTGLPVRLTPN